MNWGKLGKRFARECAQNRAKTGILGGLLLVALYMWAPLVLGFFKSPPKSTATEQTTGSTAEPVPIEETLASLPSAAAETTWDWQKLLAALANDARMRPAVLAIERDPFAPTRQETLANELQAAPTMEAVVAELPSAAAPPPEPTPTQLGLQLRATIVGGRGRTANINGMNYREGEAVAAAGVAGEAEDAIQFVLVEIGTDYVTLERSGLQHRLELPDLSPIRRGRITINTMP